MHVAALLLLLWWACNPADAHRKMAPLQCQTNGTCTPVVFQNFATEVPLTTIHQAGKFNAACARALCLH
jgi:hypothetical protein